MRCIILFVLIIPLLYSCKKESVEKHYLAYLESSYYQSMDTYHIDFDSDGEMDAGFRTYWAHPPGTPANPIFATTKRIWVYGKNGAEIAIKEVFEEFNVTNGGATTYTIDTLKIADGLAYNTPISDNLFFLDTTNSTVIVESILYNNDPPLEYYNEATNEFLGENFYIAFRKGNMFAWVNVKVIDFNTLLVISHGYNKNQVSLLAGE